MTDPMTPEELRACRERAEGPCVRPGFISRTCERGTNGCGVRHYRTADVARLLATIDAAQRETAAIRHATLFATGVRGGPGAWRWASDPAGTTLDDVAAWERMLGEMRERACTGADWCPVHDHAEPAERKPVAGWRPPTRMTEYHNLSIGGHFANAFDNGEWWVDGGHIRKAADLRAAQLAAEDEIFEIADAINELRGRK